MTNRAAIILAGGKGERFQTENGGWQDKALAILNGKPLLINTIESIQDIVDDIIVVVNKEPRRLVYSQLLQDFNVKKARTVLDLQVKESGGPLIAILTGLKYAQADYCLTVPADMPMVKKEVADYLFREIRDSSVVVPMWPNGRLETLLMVLKRTIASEISTLLSQLSRSHPDDIIRGTMKALFVSPLGRVKVLDPKLCSFININSQEDFKQLKPRLEEGLGEDIRINLGTLSTHQIAKLSAVCNKWINNEFLDAATLFGKTAESLEGEDLFFWAAVCREFEGKSLRLLSERTGQHKLNEESKTSFLLAAENYSQELLEYEKRKCYLLAKRAEDDSNWCRQQALKN